MILHTHPIAQRHTAPQHQAPSPSEKPGYRPASILPRCAAQDQVAKLTPEDDPQRLKEEVLRRDGEIRRLQVSAEDGIQVNH